MQVFINTTTLQACPSHPYAGYSGPWIEHHFRDFWRTFKPELTRIYIPVMWTDCALARKRSQMQAVLDSLDPNFAYFTVLQMARGFQHPELGLTVPPGIDLLLFASGGDTPLVKTIPIPLLKEELSPNGMEKEYQVTFQGTLETHWVRNALYKLYENHPTFTFMDNKEDWKEVIERSNFTLSPRGYGSTSFRMYEALQLGSIPIYVWDEEKWLPYQGVIDWNDFAIVIEASKISELGRIVAQADTSKMQGALTKVQHMFTYSYAIQYIIDSVRKADRSTLQPL
jgi:hypothetical protein